jgi:hypothetical protein
MCLVSDFVNDFVRCRRGRLPAPNRALLAFKAAAILRDRLLGIDTMVKAAACTGATMPSVKAAQIILQSDDPRLVRDVLRGFLPLLKTAAGIRDRINMTAAFKRASPAERAAFAAAVGAEVLFETAVSPAL